MSPMKHVFSLTPTLISSSARRLTALTCLSMLGALGQFASATETAKVKVDTAAGAAYFAANCASCHGADGNSSIAENPKLAGQHPAYLVKQLQEFKAQKRTSAVMAGFAAAMDEATMRNVAAWLGAQKAKPGFARDPQGVFSGERIYRGGIKDRMIPACAGCHSPNGAGIPAQYPRLGGQQATYTETQRTAFRDGVRTNNKTMNDIAAKMNDREIKAVADYIAGLR